MSAPEPTPELGIAQASASARAASAEYRVVETSDVSDLELTRILNEMTSDGWSLDGIQFAMREASRRPAMAFLVFQRRRATPAG